MLTDRQRMILNAIVDDYIRSAEPVGSRSISNAGMSAIARQPSVTRWQIWRNSVTWSSLIRQLDESHRIKVIVIMLIILRRRFLWTLQNCI